MFDTETVYYPNAFYDYSFNKVYYVGYTKNSYMKEDDNYLRFYQFYLPDHRIEEDQFLADKYGTTVEAVRRQRVKNFFAAVNEEINKSFYSNSGL